MERKIRGIKETALDRISKRVTWRVRVKVKIQAWFILKFRKNK